MKATAHQKCVKSDPMYVGNISDLFIFTFLICLIHLTIVYVLCFRVWLIEFFFGISFVICILHERKFLHGQSGSLLATVGLFVTGKESRFSIQIFALYSVFCLILYGFFTDTQILHNYWHKFLNSFLTNFTHIRTRIMFIYHILF